LEVLDNSRQGTGVAADLAAMSRENVLAAL
jgi:hypothetical protein